MKPSLWFRALCCAASMLAPFASPSKAIPQLELVSRSVPELRSDTAMGASTTLVVDMFFTYAHPQSVSADGRWVAFTSNAPNLVAGQIDANGTLDVFLTDQETGTTILVSRSAGTTTTTADYSSYRPSLSADGRYVAFLSSATNLVSGQVDEPPHLGSEELDVFLFDRVTGAMVLVSRQDGTTTTAASENCSNPFASPDGRFVAFLSTATNLVSGQIDGSFTEDLFLYDRMAGTMKLVSHRNGSAQTAGRSAAFTLSGNGSWIAFLSPSEDVVPGQTDANFGFDLFLYEVSTGTITLVTHVSGSPTTTGNSVNEHTDIPAISADGRRLVFASPASDLVAGVTDTNESYDVFLYDRIAGTTSLISAASTAPTVAAGGFTPVISGDGNRIAFASFGLLAPGQTSPSPGDVYLYEVASGTLTLVSHSNSSSTSGGNSSSFAPALAGNGTRVLFGSNATNLVPGQTDDVSTEDLFLFDQASGTITLVNHATGSAVTPAPVAESMARFEGPFLADDGHVVFTSGSEDLGFGQRDRNQRADVFLYDPANGTNRALSVHDPSLPSVTGNGESSPASMSADGRFLVFLSKAIDLVPGQDDRNWNGNDVFLRDRVTGETILVSHAAGAPARTGNLESRQADISRDASFIVFTSSSTDLISGLTDSNDEEDVFLFERSSGLVTLVSHAAGAPGVTANQGSSGDTISGDSRFIAFSSGATNLIAGLTDNNFNTDVFLYDRLSGTTTLASHMAGAPAATASGSSGADRLSFDGRFLAFSSKATDLVPGQVDTNTELDVFLYDRISGTTTLVSRASGSPGTTADAASSNPRLSANGRFVVFLSGGSNLVPGQTGSGGIFLYDSSAGTMSLINHASDSLVTPAAGSSGSHSIDDNGDFIAFVSLAPNLVAGQIDEIPHPLDPFTDVFLYDRRTASNTLISHTAGSAVTAANHSSPFVRISGNGVQIAFLSSATNLLPGSPPLSGFDAYLHHRLKGTMALLSPASVPPTPPPFGSTPGSFPALPSVSQDGHFVAFSSRASSLVAQDYNGQLDTFLSSDPVLPADFFLVATCRRLDTRQPGQGPALVSGAPRAVLLHGFCGVPATARAVVVNVTVTQPSASGFLTAFPGDFLIPPLASTVNFATLLTRSNNAAVSLAPDGTLALQALVGAGGTVHVIVDVFGYYE